LIPPTHPRYKSLVTRERMADCARSGIVTLEGLTAHGRGEAFDYLLGEQTSKSAAEAEQLAAVLLMSAEHPVISVNGNTAALCAEAIAALQEVSGALIEVNLFHRTEERIRKITRLLEESGCHVLQGPVQRNISLDHDRGLCHADGIAAADVIIVSLEDGDRAGVLVNMGKMVIAIDLNPLSRTAQIATLPIIDEVTRAIPAITQAIRAINSEDIIQKPMQFERRKFLTDAIMTIKKRLDDVLD
jgi:4-phosphopantoate---beta-alanine ligase